MQGRMQMLVGLGAPGLLGNLLAAGSHCWVLTKESCTQVYALERKAPLASSVDKELGGTLGAGKLGCCTAGMPFSSQSLQKSCESEPRVSGSQSLLEEDVPESLSHVQASSSRGTEPLSSLDLSHGSLVASEYVPFFRTYGRLLAVEEPALPPKVGRDRGRDQNIREAPFPEDPEPPSGFFPHYRSKEESFPSLVLPGRSCGGSQDTRTRKEALAGCFCRMAVSCRCSAVSASPGVIPRSFHSPPCCPILLVSAGHSHDSSLTVPLSSDAAFRGYGLCASGFVPYYRTPEEKLHTSPGPPSSPSGSREPTGE